jgi:hypothetical protein
MARRSRAKVYDPTLTEGWGIILIGNRRAHYYRNGYPICRYVVRWRRPPYDGKLRAARRTHTNCQRCEAVLAEELSQRFSLAVSDDRPLSLSTAWHISRGDPVKGGDDIPSPRKR